MKRALWGVLVLLALLLIVALLYPVFARERGSRQDPCVTNLHQIALGMQMYAQDYDGRLPDAARWQSQLDPYLKNTRLYTCPGGERGTGNAYAMNPRLTGKKLSDYPNPADVIAFYDADEFGRPMARHTGGTNCAFLDGHMKWVEGVPASLGGTTNGAPPTRN